MSQADEKICHRPINICHRLIKNMSQADEKICHRPIKNMSQDDKKYVTG